MDINILKCSVRHWLCGLILGAASTLTFAAPAQKILVLGDSLSAEYGLARGSGWVALLENRVAQGRSTVVNASISGETTAGALARLPSLLAQVKPNIVVIELGGNDALRGMPLPQTEKNFSKLIVLSQQAGAKVLLLGMQIPPNMGLAYAKEFASLYLRVAKDQKVASVPFFLKGVADKPNSRDFFQADGIHPLANAQPILLENVWAELQHLLK